MSTVIERDISGSEIARRLGISKRRAFKLLEDGKIPTAHREGPGRRWYAQPRGVLQYTEERGR